VGSAFTTPSKPLRSRQILNFYPATSSHGTVNSPATLVAPKMADVIGYALSCADGSPIREPRRLW